jgi:hypothetical protein
MGGKLYLVMAEIQFVRRRAEPFPGMKAGQKGIKSRDKKKKNIKK